jgi:hypothetical protein
LSQRGKFVRLRRRRDRAVEVRSCAAKSQRFITPAEQVAKELVAAVETVAENDAVRFRVQVARLPVWYVKLATYRVEDDAKTDLAKRFVAIARKAGISNISEQKSLNDWAKRQGVD